MEAPTYQTGRVENSPATVGIKSCRLRAPFARVIEGALNGSLQRIEAESGEKGRVVARGLLATPRYQAGCIRT